MSDIANAAYPWIKSLHILSFVAWMAGLFYLPRLFVYHVEEARGDAGRTALFARMEYKLLRVIMNPAMIATWLFGGLMLSIPGLGKIKKFLYRKEKCTWLESSPWRIRVI